MSIQKMTSVIEELCQAHEILLKVTQDKTTFIKDGELDKLTSLLAQERKGIRLIEKLENKRSQNLVELKQQGTLSEETTTITEILQSLPENEEAKQLGKSATRLTQAIVEIRDQEQLNQELLKQSMQFVQLSLNMMNPSIENMNYNQKQEETTIDRSAFDSKA